MNRVLAIWLVLACATASAQDEPPTVWAAVCQTGDAPAAFARITSQTDGAPLYYVPAGLLAGRGCAEVLAEPEPDRRYHTWQPARPVSVRVEVQ